MGVYREHFVGDADEGIRGGADEVAAVPPRPANQRPRHASCEDDAPLVGGGLGNCFGEKFKLTARRRERYQHGQRDACTG